jgi:hypothetical protein
VDGLAGRTAPENLAPTLTITGTGNGFVVDPQCRLDGSIALASGNVKSSTTFRNAPGFEKRTIRVGSERLPFDPEPLSAQADGLARLRLALVSDSLKRREDRLIDRADDTLLRHDTIVVTGSCVVSGVAIVNKTMVVGDTLVLTGNASCEWSVFASRRLRIESARSVNCLFYAHRGQRIDGGTHESQFFCDDSISVSRGAVPAPMGTLWISRRSAEHDTVVHGGIFFDSSGVYVGTAICYIDSGAASPGLFREYDVLLGRRSRFRGYLVSDGTVLLPPCTVLGRVWAPSVRGVNPQGYPVGSSLFGVTMDPQCGEVLFPLVGSTPVAILLSGGER